MEEESKITGYLRSLSGQMPEYLRELENKALADHVPIIRKRTQEALRFLIRQKRPLKLLELGTAVGFSASFIAEYMPENAQLITVEKVPVRLVEAKKNLKASPHASRITLIAGDALSVLRALNGKRDGCHAGIFYPGAGRPERNVETSGLRPFSGYETRNFEPDGWRDELYCWEESQGAEKETFDFIFLDAAKAQYMSYLPEILELLSPDALFITDNILQEGSVADSKFSIPRRDRTIHMRMRDYLYEITHTDELDTLLLSEGDGMAVSRRTGSFK